MRSDLRHRLPPSPLEAHSARRRRITLRLCAGSFSGNAKILPACDLIVGTEEEVRCAGGDDDLDTAIGNIRALTDAPIVLKRGADGCEVFDPLARSITCDAFPVEVLNVLGAGDGFMAGFLRGWLRGEPWETCGKYGNANGAIVVSRHACAPSMASFEELEFFMKEHPKDPSVIDSPELARLHRACEIGKPKDAPLEVLAFDHRIQFEDARRAHGKDFSVIETFKKKVYEGFQSIQPRRPEHAVLLDPIYAESSAADAVAEGTTAGMPIEASGSTPFNGSTQIALFTNNC